MPHPTTKVPLGQKPELEVFGSGMTHKGLVRETNEDMILTDPTGSLWAVADGMGGHGNGEFASDLVIDHLTTLSSFGPPKDRLEMALQSANQALVRSQETRATGLAGATVVAALYEAGHIHIAWAGDSRAYRLQSGQLKQLTHDHSIVQDLLDAGTMTTTEIENHPEAHVVTRAVGGGEILNLDHQTTPVHPEDRYLLCSDGLNRCVDDAQINQILQAYPDPEQATRMLLQAAMEKGAPDNVSAIVIVVRGI